jgi:hypothetical protein
MSFSLSARYPGRAGAPSAAYPLGSAINETVEGAEDGTPLQADWLNDIQGFIQKIHALAGKDASDIWDSLALSTGWP